MPTLIILVILTQDDHKGKFDNIEHSPDLIVDHGIKIDECNAKTLSDI